MIHIFCKWGPWGPLMVRNMVWIDYRTGAQSPFVETFQRRECQKCGKIQEREV